MFYNQSTKHAMNPWVWGWRSVVMNAWVTFPDTLGQTPIKVPEIVLSIWMYIYIYMYIIYICTYIYIYTYIHIHIWCLFASNIYVHQKLVLQYHDFHLFHHDFPVRFPPPEVPGWDGRGQCTGRQRAERLPGPGHSVDDSSALLGTYGRIPLVPWHGLGAWDS